MHNLTIDQLVKGSTGMGIGRGEATEIVRRYAAETCLDHARAVKWGGEWFLTTAEPGAESTAADRLAIKAVASFLSMKEFHTKMWNSTRTKHADTLPAPAGDA